MARRLTITATALAALLATAGCAYYDDGYGYGGLEAGYGGGYYDDGYYDDYAYAPFGWYGGYYYPGTGYYLYDRYGARRAWNDRERGYWEQRRARSAGRWRGPSEQAWRRDDRGWARRDEGNPGDGRWQGRDGAPGDGRGVGNDARDRRYPRQRATQESAAPVVPGGWRQRGMQQGAVAVPVDPAQPRPGWRQRGAAQGVEPAAPPAGWRQRAAQAPAASQPQAAAQAPRAVPPQRAQRADRAARTERARAPDPGTQQE